MKRGTRFALGLLAIAMLLPLTARSTTLRVGEKSPDFNLPDQNGKRITLSQFRGKENVVLAFYVLAFTGG